MKALRAVFLSAALICLLEGRARALDPARYISQYAHSAWRIQDGAFSGTPTAITQTKDGYLWVGTSSGLFRFDGIRFVHWNPPDEKNLLGTGIYSLLGSRDGSLWIGTGTDLFRWKDETLAYFPKELGRINCLLEDRSGTLWIARTRAVDGSGPICKVTGTVVQCKGTADGIATPFASALAADAESNLWIGSPTTLVRWRPGSVTNYPLKGLKPAEGLSGVQGVAVNRDNSLWVGIDRSGPGLGLQQLTDGVWKPFVTSSFDGTTLEVTTLYLDRHNLLWVGTQSQGLYRIRAGAVDHFGSSDGLSSDLVSEIFEDHEGDIWVVTPKGIDSFRNLAVASFTKREGLSRDDVDSVLASSTDTVWIGNTGALDSFRNGKTSSIKAENGLPGREVTSMLEDDAKRLWVGVDNGLFIYEHGRFNQILDANHGTVGFVTTMIQDTSGDVWAQVGGISGRLIQIRNRRIVNEFSNSSIPRPTVLLADRSGGIWLGLSDGKLGRFRRGHLDTLMTRSPANVGTIRNLVLDSDGSVWGAAMRAVVSWHNGQLRTLTTKNGLPCDNIYDLILDDEDSLWLYAQCGLIRITRSEIQKWWINPDVKLTVQTLDALDGVQASRASFRPSATRSSDGRLWFSNDSILQMVDPRHLNKNLVPPPVRVEQIIADGKDYPSKRSVRLPPLTHEIEINYTALSFVTPQKVRFRYQLQERDAVWQEAGGRRSAFYMNLSPAHYKFHVIACNNDGVWNGRGALLEFTIPPAWYQTVWFKAGCFFAAFALCFLFYRLRMQQVSASLQIRFDERLEERTRLARDLHDTLIQTIQGGKLVADQAREGPSDLARLQNAVDLLSEWLARAIIEGRAALATLRTSTTEGNDLAEALRRAGDDCRMNNSINVGLSSRGESKEMHPIARDEVYRIGYEAIQNACVHSGGTQISVELEYNHDLRLLVRDNGHGMEEQIVTVGKAGHFGLQGMRERALRIGGKLTLVSSQQGTEILLVVPGNTIFKAPLKRKTH